MTYHFVCGYMLLASSCRKYGI